ncbi:hypothetical protein FBQ96_08635 [Nitrospirales bacterium NOB]|nr:MAG: lipoprotein [Nitrospira sp. OLB3]MBV6469104.1 hypothetical protein [Nitrospirota bacterium]MCE7965848.1 hypothetical protein [Nitrospira sp. NTP2]MCK6493307.1 hypothetical protein [Nitrospira sp.]MDL1889628.1 hypothetical protein [Nitrospirales bacterium NOB]MEB2338487.1 hypothetical protein [Nitrospirales bacterium]
MTEHTTSAPQISAPDATPEPTPFLRQRPVRIIINTFLGLFVVSLIAFRFVPGWLDPDFSKHIESHRVMVGMDRKQVLEAWGSPNTMNVSHTSDGLRREEWIYEDWESSSVVKHRYLYFEEGKLIGGHFAGSDVRLPLPVNPEPVKPKGHP